MEIYRGEFETTASHWWWRPGWGPDSRYLTFHLTFGDEPALCEAADAAGRPGPLVLDTLFLGREGHLYRWRPLAERVLDLTGGETGR